MSHHHRIAAVVHYSVSFAICFYTFEQVNSFTLCILLLNSAKIDFKSPKLEKELKETFLFAETSSFAELGDCISNEVFSRILPCVIHKVKL